MLLVVSMFGHSSAPQNPTSSISSTSGALATPTCFPCCLASTAVLNMPRARSLSEYSPVLPHCPWVSLGLSLFGHGPRARRALSPPQLVAVLQERRQIFRRLWVKQISCHSADTFSSPRNKNLRIPRADLI